MMLRWDIDTVRRRAGGKVFARLRKAITAARRNFTKMLGA